MYHMLTNVKRQQQCDYIRVVYNIYDLCMYFLLTYESYQVYAMQH